MRGKRGAPAFLLTSPPEGGERGKHMIANLGLPRVQIPVLFNPSPLCPRPLLPLVCKKPVCHMDHISHGEGSREPRNRLYEMRLGKRKFCMPRFGLCARCRNRRDVIAGRVKKTCMHAYAVMMIASARWMGHSCRSVHALWMARSLHEACIHRIHHPC